MYIIKFYSRPHATSQSISIIISILSKRLTFVIFEIISRLFRHFYIISIMMLIILLCIVLGTTIISRITKTSSDHFIHPHTGQFFVVVAAEKETFLSITKSI